MTKRKRQRKTKSKPKPFRQAKQNDAGLRQIEYEITDQPILDRDFRRLPRQVRDTIERLHALAQSRPKEAIPKLRALIERYPEHADAV